MWDDAAMGEQLEMVHLVVMVLASLFLNYAVYDDDFGFQLI